MILANALEERPPSKSECAALLRLAPDSFEAAVLKATADLVSRRRFGNKGILLAKIGIETAPCPGNCGFCAFGKGHTDFETSQLRLEEILSRARAFSEGGDLYALFLMTMHVFKLDRLLEVVQLVRKEIPTHTQIVVNVGDFEAVQARQMRAAGVSGAYHVCRLREGIDTSLDPAARRKTFEAIRGAGLDFYYCCEPIGPEHTPEEMADQILIGIEFGCLQHAAMRRVLVPGAPLATRGQITESRLAQVVAVVAFATLGLKEIRQIAVHEPNLLGLAAGANTIYAETGANPRDTEEDTSRNRGLDIAACRKMLYEAGFTGVVRGADAESFGGSREFATFVGRVVPTWKLGEDEPFAVGLSTLVGGLDNRCALRMLGTGEVFTSPGAQTIASWAADATWTAGRWKLFGEVSQVFGVVSPRYYASGGPSDQFTDALAGIHCSQGPITYRFVYSTGLADNPHGWQSMFVPGGTIRLTRNLTLWCEHVF